MKIKRICPKCNNITYFVFNKKKSRKYATRIKPIIQKHGFCYFCNPEVHFLNLLVDKYMYIGKRRDK